MEKGAGAIVPHGGSQGACADTHRVSTEHARDGFEVSCWIGKYLATVASCINVQERRVDTTSMQISISTTLNNLCVLLVHITCVYNDLHKFFSSG
jgi:hypothetical protein